MRTELPFDLTLRPFTTSEGASRGLSEKRMRGTDLVAPVRGIRMPADDATSLRQRCAALELHLTHPNAAFSHATAAELWGMPLPYRLQSPTALHLVVWADTYPPRVRGVVGHRATAAPSTSRLGGLQLVSPADAWCQLATLLRETELVQAGDRLVGRPHALATFTEIDAAIRRYGSRRGCRVLRAAREQLRSGSESPKESTLRLDALAAGFPEPEANGVILLRSGRTTHGDLVFREWLVLLEYDGDHHREDDVQWERDVDRLNELAGNGWLVIRVSKNSNPDSWIRQLDEALRLRGWGGLALGAIA